MVYKDQQLIAEAYSKVIEEAMKCEYAKKGCKCNCGCKDCKSNQKKDVKEAIEQDLTEAKKAKKKKPDADGDGVPDWADKSPGKDDRKIKKESLNFKELYDLVINGK